MNVQRRQDNTPQDTTSTCSRSTSSSKCDSATDHSHPAQLRNNRARKRDESHNTDVDSIYGDETSDDNDEEEEEEDLYEDEPITESDSENKDLFTDDSSEQGSHSRCTCEDDEHSFSDSFINDDDSDDFEDSDSSSDDSDEFHELI